MQRNFNTQEELESCTGEDGLKIKAEYLQYSNELNPKKRKSDLASWVAQEDLGNCLWFNKPSDDEKFQFMTSLIIFEDPTIEEIKNLKKIL